MLYESSLQNLFVSVMVALGEKDIILHPICVVPPERHYDSCKELKDDLKWFEESRAYFYKLHPEFNLRKDNSSKSN